jgi:OOP family OmpA-OmpF porin
MKKHYLQILVIGMVGALILGCAAQKLQQSQTSFTPQQFPAGDYAPKVDNFIVVLDASSSMGEWYNGQTKFNLAKNIVDRMNQTIPDIKMNGALRTFGHSQKLSREKTVLFYGLTDYSQAGFQAGLDKVKRAGGTTPMASAINAATGDLASAQGKIAVIVVSDGKDPDHSPVKAAQALKGKFDDRLCIYTILVGDNVAGKALMEKLAQTGECGFSVNADDIASADSMADFVEKVFLTHHLDSDGDGVSDYMDKCPGTPAGVRVDAQGCPLDTDGDGVYDYLDKCPHTPRGLKVDKVGCPLDTDGDGVYDHRDKCLETPVGAKVNAEGCWVLGEVLFDTDKSVIKTLAFSMLDEVVNVLKKNPELSVEFGGHTDSVGTTAYNMKLSQRRANAVKAYLVNMGIDAQRLSTAGYGLTKPVASNDTVEGRSLNRRVEIKPIR